jgi:hypothetical protein
MSECHLSLDERQEAIEALDKLEATGTAQRDVAGLLGLEALPVGQDVATLRAALTWKSAKLPERKVY